MGAPIGNRFWELRSKHGRKKLFEKPSLLWEAACEYFEWCHENPLIEMDWVGKDADAVERPKLRVFTLHGLCLYLDCSTSYFRAFKSTCKASDKDFLTVIEKLEEIIYNQQFTGAASAFFNANIIARNLGLRDKVDSEITGKDGESFNITLKI